VKLRLLSLLMVIACREAVAPSGATASPQSTNTSRGAPVANVIASTRVAASNPGVESAKDYEFAVEGEHFKLDRTGLFTCRAGVTARGSFQLDLRQLPHLEELQFLRYGREMLVLLYELSDGEGGLAQITGVHISTCELSFTAELPGFNLGPAVLENATLYVSVIGFVGRLDLETWRFDWTHGNLYKRHQMNAFGRPIVYDDRVVFPEIAWSGSDPRAVVVGKRSGAMEILPQVPSSSRRKGAG